MVSCVIACSKDYCLPNEYVQKRPNVTSFSSESKGNTNILENDSFHCDLTSV